MSPKQVARFWAKIDTTGACWLWTASRKPGGYGQVHDPRSRAIVYAHRMAWELTHGPIPDGLHVCHRCDNPPCCNPDHLFLGTRRDNMADAALKGRMAAGARHHNTKLTSEQILEIQQAQAAGARAKDLQARYGVSHRTLWGIRHGKLRMFREVNPDGLAIGKAA